MACRIPLSKRGLVINKKAAVELDPARPPPHHRGYHTKTTRGGTHDDRPAEPACHPCRTPRPPAGPATTPQTWPRSPAGVHGSAVPQGLGGDDRAPPAYRHRVA